MKTGNYFFFPEFVPSTQDSEPKISVLVTMLFKLFSLSLEALIISGNLSFQCRVISNAVKIDIYTATLLASHDRAILR
jgi:hypothetical protein